MSEYRWLDVIELGRQVGVPERTFVPPVPGETHKITEQYWDGAFLRRAIALAAAYKQQGGTVVLTGHVDAWVLLGIGNSLKPECEIMFGASLYGPDSEPVVTPLLELKLGEKNPELRFDCTMQIDGDNCYLNYRTDDPSAPPGVVHTFDNARLSELVLPVVPADKNLFLHAKASYYVQMNVTNSYMRHAKSVSTAYHDAPYYHCAYSATPEMQVGDATPRRDPG